MTLILYKHRNYDNTYMFHHHKNHNSRATGWWRGSFGMNIWCFDPDNTSVWVKMNNSEAEKAIRDLTIIEEEIK